MDDDEYIHEVNQWEQQKQQRETAAQARKAAERATRRWFFRTMFLLVLLGFGGWWSYHNLLVPQLAVWNQEKEQAKQARKDHLRALEEAQTRCIQQLGVDTCLLLEERALRLCLRDSDYDTANCVEQRISQ